MNRSDVVIVGCGVIGAATAYELARRGTSVTVIEGEYPAYGASGRNVGFLWSDTRREGVEMEYALAGRRRYDTLVDEIDDFEFRAGGGMIYFFEHQQHIFPAFVESRRKAGLDMELLDAQAARERCPILPEDIGGATWNPADGHVRPEAVTQSLIKAAQQHGARLVQGTPVTGLEIAGGRCTGVRTADGGYAGDTVIVAAGAWTPTLLDPIGVRVPIDAMRLQVIETEPIEQRFDPVLYGSTAIKQYALTKVLDGFDPDDFTHPLENAIPGTENLELAAQRQDGSVILGISMDFVGLDHRLSVGAMALTMGVIADHLPALRDLPIRRTWAGLLPQTPDALPIMDRAPGIDNLVIAAGHVFGQGAGPFTGLLLSQMVLGEPTELDMSPFRYDREAIREAVDSAAELRNLVSRRGDDPGWNRRRRPTPKAEVDVADSVVVPAEADAIIAQLRDIEFVASCLPGLVPDSLTPADDGSYAAQMRQTALGVTATWAISIVLDAPPDRRGVSVVLAGTEPRLNLTMAGTADVDVATDTEAGAPVAYRGHVVVEGRLAATGGPIIRRLVGEILGRFVAALAASGRKARPTRASSAIAAGAPAVARSFRFHRARGATCGEGWCFQCKTKDGLACRLPADGATISRDRLRPLGRFAERYPPWFYERRLLRPRALRGRFLHALRHLSAAPELGEAPTAREPRSYVRESVAAVVVGNAPAPDDAVRVGGTTGRTIVGIYPDRVIGLLDGDQLREIAFERLILEPTRRLRLPPIAGNDLPGVIGADALRRYLDAGDVPRGRRLAVWGSDDASSDIRTLAERRGLIVAWASATAPRRILGSDRVTGVDVGEQVACDLFVTAVSQPALELVLQAGATARLTDGELPVLVLDDIPDWIEIIGDAAVTGSGIPDVAADGSAFACFCEDVRIRDLRDCVAQGFTDAELVKRRTGAMTGPCQGKLCACNVLAELRALGVPARPTTARPLAQPITLGELAAGA